MGLSLGPLPELQPRKELPLGNKQGLTLGFVPLTLPWDPCLVLFHV